jgi:hypothetical protein
VLKQIEKLSFTSRPHRIKSKKRSCSPGGRTALQFIVLGPGELVVRDEPVLVLVLVLEDLFDELVVVGQHVLHFFARRLALGRHHLLLQVLAHLQHPTFDQPPPVLPPHPLTSSRLSWLSLSLSISLKTLVVGGESPMLSSSTSKRRVAPPGMTFPAPRSP